MKIKELKKELYLGDLGDRFCDYDNGYICDIITEIADNNIDIYYYDLFEWAKNNYGTIQEANEEFGTPTDIIKQIQQGQFLAFERELYENLGDSLKNYVLNYIEHTLKLTEISSKKWEEIENEIDFEDNNEEIENIIEQVNEILSIKE